MIDETYWRNQGKADARQDWRYRNTRKYLEHPHLARYRLAESMPLFQNDPPRWAAYEAGYQTEWRKHRERDAAAVS